ncbi:DGQHR domain-containing protein [Paenibacillus sp. ISL-20]|uniref:DGQHR domain-containing protein n=1 Tax=Paenibacillus sp. ISL-20 TaxID=2819163 RepID=UPI001BEA3F88|nr:DGQHR domain-containing protein [Paenibacillus sp. ISL-20]MBT2766020.1 DGQHR domain-containing protein [Paenibacillus sp. ISL-20]
MENLPHQVVIENVLQCKMRGKVAYQSQFPATVGLNLTYVKPYNDPSGKGYQRPTDMKRVDDFAMYLSKGDDSLFTPILLNAAGMWEFSAYDTNRPMYGRLLCKSKASLMDGQHRIGGIKRYIDETNSEINIPFMAFHFLDEDEEIRLFDTINTKAKGISSSLSRYLKRESDELSWMATELLTINGSPFIHLGSITGKRSKGRHITLQNLYRVLKYFFKEANVSHLTKHEKVEIAIRYFNLIRENYPNEWMNYKEFKLTHIVCLDALAMAGSKLLLHSRKENSKHIDYDKFTRSVKQLRKIDWSTEGPLKYLKGISGSKTLAVELFDMMYLD